MAKKNFVDSAVDKRMEELNRSVAAEHRETDRQVKANKGKYPYDTGFTGKPDGTVEYRNDEVSHDMLKYKDTEGDVHPDGTQDGSLGDGSMTKMKSWGDSPKVGYAEKAKLGREAKEGARGRFGSGRGYSSASQDEYGDRLKREATEEGTVARKKLIERYRKQR